MDKQELLSKRHEALEKLEGSLLEELIAARLGEPDEEKNVEILTVIFPELGLDGDGAVGELFFLPPDSEEDSVQHFSTVITIADDLEEERLPELYEAVSFINFRLPCGCYVIDKDTGLLAFKLTVPLSVDLTEDELLRDMNICSGNAVAVVDMHMDLLLGILDGEASMADVRAAFYTG